MGNPLLSEKLDSQLQQMINDMRSRGTAIGTSVIIGVGSGILLKHEKSTDAQIGLRACCRGWATQSERQTVHVKFAR